MRGGPPRLALAVAAGLLLFLVVRVLTAPGERARPGPPAPDDVSAAAPGASAPAPSAPVARAKEPTSATNDRDPDPLADIDAKAQAWAGVDFDEVRELLPDNLYWTMGFPTKDPAILEQREAERARWNVEYGKVLSNTATAEEVDAYYAQRERLSRDYAAFAGFLLAKYSDKLPKQDAALLKLSVEMHMAKLQEIPRQIAEAHERRKAQEAVRQAWLEEQKAFAPADAPPP
jgi:hypothetical protein